MSERPCEKVDRVLYALEERKKRGVLRIEDVLELIKRL